MNKLSIFHVQLGTFLLSPFVTAYFLGQSSTLNLVPFCLQLGTKFHPAFSLKVFFVLELT